MKKFIITILSIVLFIAISITINWYKNQPTIIDLGNGWKSYSHPQNVFTVKIPSDAEVEIEKIGDKRDKISFSFSEGPFYGMNTWLGDTPRNKGLDTKTANKKHLEKFGHPVLGEERIRTGRWGGESVRSSREFLIADNWAIVTFEENAQKSKQGEETTWSFKAERLFVVSKGKNKSYTIYLRPEYFKKEVIATPDRPPYTQEEIEGFIDEYINQIEDLVISIDNF